MSLLKQLRNLSYEMASQYNYDGFSSALRWGLDRGAQIALSPVARTSQKILSPMLLSAEELKTKLRHSSNIIEYGESKRAIIKEPDFYDNSDEDISERVGEYEISRPWVGSVDRATVIGTYPIVFRGKKVVTEAVGGPQVHLANMFYTLSEFGAHPKQFLSAGQAHPNDVVLLCNSWNSGYFHWVTESLSRLEGVEAYEQATGIRPTLLLDPNPTDFQIESLKLAGYSESDWITWDCNRGIVENLIVPTNRREADYSSYSLFDPSWLRRTLRPSAIKKIDQSNFSERVYISRSDASSRRVVNEEAVLEMLESRGFEKYNLALMSVAETIALFEQAEIIVAPHGAGLTDIIYADDAAIVELFRGAANTRVYFMLAKQLNMWYGYLNCEAIGPDMHVDLARLNTVLNAAYNNG